MFCIKCQSIAEWLDKIHSYEKYGISTDNFVLIKYKKDNNGFRAEDFPYAVGIEDEELFILAKLVT